MMAQVAPRVGDVAFNTGLVLDAMGRAKAVDCDVLVLPELVLTGYPPEDLLLRSSFMDAVECAVDRIVTVSEKVIVVFGHPRRTGNGLANSASLAADGVLLGIYDKRALPNYGVFDERRYFTPGTGQEVFPVHHWRIGVGICEDLWGQDEVVFDGGSHAVDAAGEVLERAPLFETADALVDIAEPCGQVAKIPPAIEQIHQALVLGVRDYVHRNGVSQAVIGLSGGIDSAVVAVLACEALEAENVLGVLMPSWFSSPDSVTDAEELANNLGMETVTLPIARPVASVETLLTEPFKQWGKSTPDVTEENIQARIRGLLLMAISNKTGRMLLSTGNKSEMAVGYATLYGDMAGGFAVLKDVYKTQVYTLAKHLNHKQEVIPRNSIEKPPSAELRPEQKDSDSLPDYATIDAILQAYIELGQSAAFIVAQGFDPDDVHDMIRMLHMAEYKRRQAPPGVKITQKAFGRDRRYPITHGFREWEENK